MYRIRRFGVIRTATMVATMYAVVIAIIGVPLVILAILWTTTGDDALSAPVLGAAVVGYLLLLVLYTLIGWIVTAVACLVYNAAARIAGGIEVEVVDAQ
jgi:hypothetical protein